jgi:hypothetical protein
VSLIIFWDPTYADAEKLLQDKMLYRCVLCLEMAQFRGPDPVTLLLISLPPLLEPRQRSSSKRETSIAVRVPSLISGGNDAPARCNRTRRARDVQRLLADADLHGGGR